ncbi:hypothetical protein L1987_38539 [Smallanthus sonchifolius]|uniref:Uncharacterized protein n=1 Tax=Smallanthus sonchifolius TaxID=185202 RepID=A0ACB9HIX9_9ASTR|nr:hypothetical protein L1987_38539 [Smallanthus sonchifolius]
MARHLSCRGGHGCTPELKKGYEQLVRSLDQTWSRNLDTISEATDCTPLILLEAAVQVDSSSLSPSPVNLEALDAMVIEFVKWLFDFCSTAKVDDDEESGCMIWVFGDVGCKVRYNNANLMLMWEDGFCRGRFEEMDGC